MRIYIGNKSKLWIISSFFAAATIFTYCRFIFLDKNHLFSYLGWICYFLAFYFSLLLFGLKKEQFLKNLKTQWHIVFLIGIVILNVFFYIFNRTSAQLLVLSESLNMLFIILISVIGFSILKPSIIESILTRYYFIAFIVGTIFIISHFLGIIERNNYLNSNTRGLLIVPFLIYLLIKWKNPYVKLIFYLFGGIYLYFSNANTAFIAFLGLPLFMLINNILKRPRVLYTLMFVLGLTACVLIGIFGGEFFVELLTKRNVLWHFYLLDSVSSIQNFLAGTGVWKLTDVPYPFPGLDGLNAHNGYISFFHFNGIFAVTLYIAFIIFGTKITSDSFSVSDGILFFAIVFQFAEANAPLFSFAFPSFILYANVLLNKNISYQKNN